MNIKHLMIKQIQYSQNRLLMNMLDPNYANAMASLPVHARVSDWLSLDSGSKLLELGCGPGKYVSMFSALGFNVVGVDPVNFDTWDELSKHADVDLRCGVYAESLPFSDSYFDHAACLGTLLYIDKPDLALNELRRVLKAGGRLVLRTVNKNNFYTLRTGRKLDPGSRNLFSMDELVVLLERAGFEVEHTFSHGFWPPAFPDFWWYLDCVWVPLWLKNMLSQLTNPRNRVNNVIFARAI